MNGSNVGAMNETKDNEVPLDRTFASMNALLAALRGRKPYNFTLLAEGIARFKCVHEHCSFGLFALTHLNTVTATLVARHNCDDDNKQMDVVIDANTCSSSPASLAATYSAVGESVSYRDNFCRPLQIHDSGFDVQRVNVTLNASLDLTRGVRLQRDPDTVETRECSVVVLDGLFGEVERKAIYEHVTAVDYKGEAPPLEKWERLTADHTSDTPGENLSWGVRAHVMSGLRDLPALKEIGSRLAKIYPEYIIAAQPCNSTFTTPTSSSSFSSSSSSLSDAEFRCDEFVVNAPVAHEHFRWHYDCDPSAMPDSPWVDKHGRYVNGEPGKPLFATLLLYLDDFWPRSFDAETLFLDDDTDTGIFVRPKACRACLMDMDVYHRISAPSAKARRPRYSLAWKLLFWPNPAFFSAKDLVSVRASIARPEWPVRQAFGSVSCTGFPARESSSDSRPTSEASQDSTGHGHKRTHSAIEQSSDSNDNTHMQEEGEGDTMRRAASKRAKK
jgi:hypothetical protein